MRSNLLLACSSDSRRCSGGNHHTENEGSIDVVYFLTPLGTFPVYILGTWRMDFGIYTPIAVDGFK